jgi:hypothetical protein
MKRNRKHSKELKTLKIPEVAIFICAVLLFLDLVCFAETDEKKFLLSRIKAEIGDGSQVNVMLRTGRFAKGEIYDTSGLNAKGPFIQEAPGEMIIVSNGFAKIITQDQSLINIGGEFLVDNLLNLRVRGNWDGKKEGALHMLLGKITMFDYEFISNSNYPFIFRMTRDGYVYQNGTGRIRDLITGEVYVLIPQREDTDKCNIDLIDRLVYEKECCELLIKGQIKQGITIEECVNHLCK